MKRLRHPIRAIREPFGTAGLIVACIALLAALGGTALAAAKLNSTQKKEVEKIAKKYAGKPGANGTNGSPGAKGDTGPAGGTGPAGQSVTSKPIAAGGACGTGIAGVEYTSASGTNNVCNGAKGTNGTPGQPWTAGGTLPASGEPGCPCSEKGAWGVAAPPVLFEGNEVVLDTISFPIPLEEAPEPHVMLVGEPPATGCSGSAAAPVAAPGNLCIFVATEEHLTEVIPGDPASGELGSGLGQAGPTGALLVIPPTLGATSVNAYGTWAVTAE